MRIAYRTIARKATVLLVLLFVVAFVCSCKCPLCSKQPCAKADKIKVVVVTGGHDFEHDPFLALFKGYDDIECVEAAQKDHSELFEDITGWDYDVIVLYNMTQNISPKRQENFVKLLNKGVGLVAMHHAVGAFQKWPEYRRIIGAKFYLQDTTEDGVTHKQGQYKHGVDFTVHIADTKHPITRGLTNFAINDETYKQCWFADDNHVLLTTDEPTSDKTLASVRKYGKTHVCSMQLGHDSKAYANPAFRQLVAQSIRWCAGKLK